MKTVKFILTFALVAATQIIFSAFALAQDHGGGDAGMMSNGKMAAAIAISVAAFGGALGQGKAASTALEGIARNPAAAGKIQTPMILALALIESLVIYALVIAFMIK